MSEPTKAELVGAIEALNSAVQAMANAFDNDRNPNRADVIHSWAEQADRIARRFLDAFPPNFGRIVNDL